MQTNTKLSGVHGQKIVDLCPYCAENCEKVMVHGHYQCTNCGKNVTECCQGEMVEDYSGPNDNGQM